VIGSRGLASVFPLADQAGPLLCPGLIAPFVLSGSLVLPSYNVVQGVLLPLMVLACWLPYRRRAKVLGAEGRALPDWRQACFAAGLVVFAVAFSAPMDRLSDQLLTAHMLEHLLLGDLGALLLVLGLTVPLLQPLLRIKAIDRLRILTHPLVALPVWAINFYVWHLPVLYEAALRHDLIHAIEHASFIAFGMAMWMALLGPFPRPAWFGNGAKFVYIVLVRLIGTVLGNVFMWSGTVFYPYYGAGDAHFHIAPLADQSTAGAVMMVEESILTLGLLAWLFLRAAKEGEERQSLLDYAHQNQLELSEARASRAVAAGRGAALRKRLAQAQAAAVSAPTTSHNSHQGVHR
jgi:putative membrane protein